MYAKEAGMPDTSYASLIPRLLDMMKAAKGEERQRESCEQEPALNLVSTALQFICFIA